MYEPTFTNVGTGVLDGPLYEVRKCSYGPSRTPVPTIFYVIARGAMGALPVAEEAT